MRLSVQASAGAGKLMAHVCRLLLLLGIALALRPRQVHALIDPSFTPVELVEASRRIVAGKLAADKQRGRWVVANVRVMKGRNGGDRQLSLALPKAEDTRKLRALLHACLGAEVMVFQGGYEGIETGYMLVGNTWLNVKPVGATHWRLAGNADQMRRTYAGAADKLIGMTEYILRHEDADVPVATGVAWHRCVPVATVNGEVRKLAWLPPARDETRNRILVASTAGDRLFAYDTKRQSFVAVPMQGVAKRHSSAGTTGGASRIVADFDGDGYADRLQLRRKGSLLRRGGADGFHAPEPTALTAGPPPVRSCVGDFDADGRLDLFVSDAKRSALWENAGDGTFRNVTRYAGSLQFRVESGPSDILATDLNHDGRTDLLVLSAKGRLVYHFNRGFRCFAAVGELALPRPNASKSRPVRITAGDFNGDGSLDLAVAFASGDVVCCFNKRSGEPALWLRLPKGRTGPVTVSVWQEAPRPYNVGTYSVVAHDPPTFVTLRKRGPCMLKWHAPGTPVRTKTVTVTTHAAQVEVEAAGRPEHQSRQ